MEVRFFLTDQDYWNLTKYNFSRTRTLVSTRNSLIAFVLVFALYLFLSPSSGLLKNILSVILPLLLLFLIVVFLRWPMRSRSHAILELQGEHIIVINPEGLRHRTGLTESLTFWHAIETITMDKYGLYFILLSNRLTAHAIPRHAFATAQEVQAFFELAQIYWTNGRTRPPQE